MENETGKEEVRDAAVIAEESREDAAKGGAGAGDAIREPRAAEAGLTKKEEPQAAGAELTDDEKKLVRNYAVNDPEVRRAIIGDYISRLKNAHYVPEVMQGDAGSSPVFVPRAARDMREAAVLAEALLKRK